MTFHILVTARSFANTPGPHHDYLRDNDCNVDLRAPQHPMSAAELGELIPGYDGAILGLDSCDASVIEKADKLRVISRQGVGLDEVDLKAAARKNIAVTTTPGTNGSAVAELTIGLIFALARSIPLVAQAMRTGETKRPAGWELSGKTLGVIGFGAIGRAVGVKAAALGMTILAYDPFWTQDVPGAERSDLESLLARADVVTLHSALTPDTANLINAERLEHMKKGAYLINTARGGLVDETALYDALKSGKLGGAAADAFVNEPPTGSPLLTLDNFIATPHIGATTREASLAMSLMAAQNLVAVLQGDDCPNIVNRDLLKK